VVWPDAGVTGAVRGAIVTPRGVFPVDAAAAAAAAAAD
jgi:hypothetical protein